LGLQRSQAGPFGKADRMAYLSAACVVAAFAQPLHWALGPTWTWAMAGYVGLAVLTILHRSIRMWRQARHD
jgi:hypothetical protein